MYANYLVWCMCAFGCYCAVLYVRHLIVLLYALILQYNIYVFVWFETTNNVFDNNIHVLCLS